MLSRRINMDPVNPKALKGKFKDREDKDIDNDGDSDASDEYLHKRRSAVSKAIKSVKEAAPKIGVDNVAKIRAQDHANKPAKVKPMNSTQRSLASIRAKSESVDEAKMTPDQMRKALDDDKANAKSKDKVSLKKAPWDMKESVELDEAKLSQQQRDRLDDLIFNVMITGNIEYDGKDNPTRHLKTIEKEFGPKVAKQVEAGMDIKNWGRDNRSSGIDRLALRKKSRISASGKMNKQDAVALGKRIMQDKSFGGLTKKVKLPEDTQIDEISMTKMAAYAPKAVKSRNDAKAATHSADSNRVANAKKVIAKRKAGADNYNKKMWGYGNVAPTKESVELDEKSPAIKQDNIKVIRTADKAHSDAMGRTPAGRKKPTKAPVVEAKVGPSHDEIMKAIGNTQSSAQGMAILQKKFKLTAAQARKHMDMFLKDDVNEGAPYDSGWKDAKPEVKKDKFGNVIKDKNVAKNLAKSAMKSFKDIRKK